DDRAGWELPTAAHRPAGQAVALGPAAGFLDLGRPEAVRVEVLEKPLDSPDLDVLETGPRKPSQRLVQRVRLEADARAGLDRGHVGASCGSSRPQTSRWNSTNPSG